MSTTYVPDFDADEFDTFPVDFEEQPPEQVPDTTPIVFVCPTCGYTISANEVNIGDYVFDSLPDTPAGNYYFDTGKCYLCDTKMEVQHEVNQ